MSVLRNSSVAFDIKLPYFPSDHPCEDQLDTFTKQKVDAMKHEINGVIRRCEEDLLNFAKNVANMNHVVVWCCSWTEIDWKEYSSESTHHERYFLHKYQAENCRDQNSGSTIQEVAVLKNGSNYYKFVNQNGSPTPSIIYVELSAEDKQRQSRETEIANLQQRLKYLQNGGSGW